MRSEIVLAIATLAACGDDTNKPEHWPDANPHTIDAAPPWWQPSPGSVGHWDVQLAPTFDTETSRTMLVYRLWDLASASTITYDDGSTVQVPAGALAGRLADLRARRPQPLIVCELGVGAVDLTEPDAKKFPGFEASPPDDPTPPKAGSVIGWSTTLPTHHRWLDIRTAARATIAPLIAKRFELAAKLGCDGVLPDEADMYQIVSTACPSGPTCPGTGTGFSPPVDFPQTQSWYEAIADQAHAQKLSVGMRGDFQLAGPLAAAFDWVVAERCGEDGNCRDYSDPFTQLHKAALPLDYDHDRDGNPQNVGTTCGGQQSAGLADGIVKDATLTSASYFACADFMP